jgi:hypothetical protein
MDSDRLARFLARTAYAGGARECATAGQPLGRTHLYRTHSITFYLRSVNTHTHTHTHIRVYVYTKIVAPCVCIHENRGPVLAISKATKCQKGLLRNPPFRAKFLYTYTNTHTHAHTHTSCNKMRIFLEPVFLPLSGRERWPV